MDSSNVLVLCSLENYGVGDEADGMFDMGAETMALTMEGQIQFEQGNDGMSFW